MSSTGQKLVQFKLLVINLSLLSPLEKKNNNLMTKTMSYVHGEQREQRCIMGAPPEAWAYGSITMGCFRVSLSHL